MSDSMDSPRARRSSFLSLSPATSDSYPRMPSASSSHHQQATSNRPRRASSSASASASGFKILKLSPVYWGEHIDENQDDFHFDDDDVVVPSAQKPSSASASASASSSSGGFLPLAPDISSSYPGPAPQQSISSHDSSSRRSSSASTSTSTSSSSSSPSSYTATGFKVLKLGPVYGGHHADEHKADFYDVPHSPLGEHMT